MLAVGLLLLLESLFALLKKLKSDSALASTVVFFLPFKSCQYFLGFEYFSCRIFLIVFRLCFV